MTLTELRYIVALARERHFGRAAEACFVSQPTLSVAVRKLEEELGVSIFERNANDLSVTPIGARIVAQAQRALAGIGGRQRDRQERAGSVERAFAYWRHLHYRAVSAPGADSAAASPRAGHAADHRRKLHCGIGGEIKTRRTGL